MTTEELFWRLLRAGLWNQPVQGVTERVSNAQWEELCKLAEKQTLTGVMYEGMCKLPTELQPQGPVRMKWLFTTTRIEQTHRKLNHVLAQLVDRCQAEGIPHLLLKNPNVICSQKSRWNCLRKFYQQ